MAKAHALDESLDNAMVCNRLMRFGCGRCWHLCQFLPRNLSTVGNQRAVFGHGSSCRIRYGLLLPEFGAVGKLRIKPMRLQSGLMADASGILAQPLLLKASDTLAQILDVVCGHLKLSDLIDHRMEVSKASDGAADLSIEHGYIFSSTPKQKGRFDLFETHLLSKEPSSQLLVRGRKWAIHASARLKQAAYLLDVVSFVVCDMRGCQPLIGPESIADLDFANVVLVHG
jgi:hypothetical protein